MRSDPVTANVPCADAAADTLSAADVAPETAERSAGRPNRYFVNRSQIQIRRPDRAVGDPSESLRVEVSADGGKNWRCIGEMEGGRNFLSFDAPADGEYQVRFHASADFDLDSLEDERTAATDASDRIYLVDTSAPHAEAAVTPMRDAYRPGDVVCVNWCSRDDHALDQPVQVSLCTAQGVWQVLAAEQRAEGQLSFVLPPTEAAGEVRVQVEAIDRAGNLATVQAPAMRLDGSMEIGTPPAIDAPTDSFEARPVALETALPVNLSEDLQAAIDASAGVAPVELALIESADDDIEMIVEPDEVVEAALRSIAAGDPIRWTLRTEKEPSPVPEAAGPGRPTIEDLIEEFEGVLPSVAPIASPESELLSVIEEELLPLLVGETAKPIRTAHSMDAVTETPADHGSDAVEWLEFDDLDAPSLAAEPVVAEPLVPEMPAMTENGPPTPRDTAMAGRPWQVLGGVESPAARGDAVSHRSGLLSDLSHRVFDQLRREWREQIRATALPSLPVYEARRGAETPTLAETPEPSEPDPGGEDLDLDLGIEPF